MTNTNIIQKATAEQAVAKKENKGLKAYLKSMEPAIKAALPSVMTPERFTRIVATALGSNPVLAQCTPQSFLGAMMTAAQLGVEPNTPLGQAYLLPYKNNKNNTIDCQFQLGYRGLIDLAYRSGEIATIQAHEVRENDTFEFEYGLNPKLRHVPARGDRGNVVYYYAAFTTKNGGQFFAVSSVEDITAHAKKYSKSFNFGPWQTNFDEMAKKTVLKAVLKYAPLKSDFVKAVASDATVKTDIAADMADVPSAETTIDISSEDNSQEENVTP